MKLRQILALLFATLLVSIVAPGVSLVADAATPTVVFDDMEHGDPGANGWFSFGGAVGGGGISASPETPPSDGGSFGLETGWGSGGVAGFYGGFGRTNPSDLSGSDHFNFWINPTADQSYTLEVNLQDDDDGNDAADPATDDEFQYDCVVSPAGPCAVAGGGWQLVSIPLVDFVDDNSLYTTGNGVLDAVPTSAGGNGQLINVVVAVVGSGTDANFTTDYWVFSEGALGGGEGEVVIIDDFEDGLASGTTGEGVSVGYFVVSDGSPVSIATTATPPAPVPDSGADNDVLVYEGDVSGFGVFIHGFTDDGATQWLTQDWSGSEGLGLWVYGQNTGTSFFIDVIDNRNPDSVVDDAERFTVTFADDFDGWQFLEFPFADFVRKEIGNGAPNDGFTLTQVHGWAFGTLATDGVQRFYLDDAQLYGEAVLPDLAVTFTSARFDIDEGSTGEITVKLNRALGDDDPSSVSVDYATVGGLATEGREYTPTSGTLTFVQGGPSQLSFSLETFDDSKWEGDERIALRLSNPVNAELDFAVTASAFITENDPLDPLLIDDFERSPDLWASETVALSQTELSTGNANARPGQDPREGVLVADGAGTISTDFAIGQDWSANQALTFWYYGSGSGDEVTVNLDDNRAADPGPAGWDLAWSDEFNEAAGTPPNPENWTYEIGDVTPDGKNGWGNSERQYYTDDPANAATDGDGNLAVTVREADGSLECYYGTCEYTSARLISWHKAEFAYGRVESRIKVPAGAGIWPAFWSLGTDIDSNPWPGTGEIDFMEYVGRVPNEIFGTIHGPGYAGGASYGNTYDFGLPVFNDFHTFTVEWQPNLITWFVDGIQYHTATPADVSPNEWVFNDPVFLLLNVAMGGNFGGDIDPDIALPASMLVDYVRVYQGPDTAERFDASFVDDFTGWQQVTVPFSAFDRSADQPAGAPDDGLTLTDVWGYGFVLPGASTMIDLVRLDPVPPPTSAIVTNAANAGAGSLRDIAATVAPGGTITFDPALAGSTIALSGPIELKQNVSIDASDAPGLVLDGGGSDRILVVDAGVTASVSNLTMTNGYGFQLAGAVLNNGDLTLDAVEVVGNVMTTDNGDFWQGGGGIYNGDGASLTLINSTVSNNDSGWAGGGIYSFFNATTTIENSTISGNTTADVGGGLRLLSDASITNSTIGGNTATGWHGGAVFATDGVVDLTNVTVADNASAGPSALFVGTFGPTSATLNLSNTIVSDAAAGCFVAYFGAGAVELNADANNVFTDATCSPGTSDQVVENAGLNDLADNGATTKTHALTPTSPAIDAADAGLCPEADQRGILRPQGSGCDVGAFELESASLTTCFGSAITIYGTEGDDRLQGTMGVDVIMGLGGDDVINGLSGDDIICAGDGEDRVLGGDGADIIFGGRGDDDLIGNNGDDMVYGNAGDDDIKGGGGDDELEGGPGDDSLHGGGGTDSCRGAESTRQCE